MTSSERTIVQRSSVGGGPRGTTEPLRAVSGVQLAQGIGQQEARGFWADAITQVLRRRTAVAGLSWIGFVLLCAVLAPVIASGHPLFMRELGAAGGARTSSPLWESLSAADIALLALALLGPLWIGLPTSLMRLKRSTRALVLLAAGLQIGLTIAIAGMIASSFVGRDLSAERLAFARQPNFSLIVGARVALGVAAVMLLLPIVRWLPGRVLVVGAVCVASSVLLQHRLVEMPERFDYRQRQAAGEIEATYTLVPFSPRERSTLWFRKAPLSTLEQAEKDRFQQSAGDRTFVLGTDNFGSDVLSQMIHAARLSISLGLVSTSIAVLIGVTMGAVMGYFGGWIDLLLFRVLEVFMSVPVLFLLIVASGVLPDEFRSTYVMMAIIGMFTWTGAARFTRAEFMKLRNQDFVQSAKAVGLPLPAILFRHMLPNGVTPVLVEASFMIASAILIEAVLSFLGLGPVDQSSWGKLLQDATGEGAFNWWLAIFPGVAIFLTVLSYNLVGEALRDAIDPKLKKARV